MSLCLSDQWHSVFLDGPQEMHSSSNSSSLQGRESVQVFPVFWPRCCLVPLISSLACHCSILKFTIVYPFSYVSVHFVHILSAPCCHSSIWSRGMSWSRGIEAERQRSKQYNYCMWMRTRVRMCIRVHASVCSAEFQDPSSPGYDGGWFICPLRTAPSLNINPAPSLSLRPVH